MMNEADAPLRLPHAVVPHGQMPGDTEEHSVVPPGQDDTDLAPPNVETLRRMFDESRDQTDIARKSQEMCQDYYDGPAQLRSEVRTILKQRGQPPIFDNRIAPAIDGILGVMEGGKTDPRAFPRNPQDQGSADVATKTLRYVADRARFHQVKMDCAEDYLKQGLCAAIVEWDMTNITVRQIEWATFFYDPKSRKNDFSDAKYMGVAKWMYVDEITSHPDYGARAKMLGDIATMADGPVDDTWDDKPNDKMRWVDRRRNRVLVVEIYYRHAGEWLRCVYCAAGWLEFGKSPYVNVLTGETRCPIEAQSFKVDRQNNRYSPILNMMPMQDEVNARRSRGLHLLNSRQIEQTDPSAPPIDVEEARREMARADGVVPPGYQAVPTQDMAAGNLQMLAEAKDSLSRMVPVAIAQDLREGNAASGRARQVAQQAGLTQFGRGFGRFDDFEERLYRQMWNSAQQFWTNPMYIRVTDNPRAPEFLQINEPVMGLVMQPVAGPDGQPVMDPMTGQPQMQQTMGQTGVEKRIAAMDMDIIIATTPDTVALEQEVYDSLMELVKSGVDPFSPQFQLLLMLAPLPDKTGVMERIEALKATIAKEGAQKAEMEAKAAQRQMAVAEAAEVAKIEKMEADTRKTDADAHKTATDADLGQVQLYSQLGMDPMLALAPEQSAEPPQTMPQEQLEQPMQPPPEMPQGPM